MSDVINLEPSGSNVEHLNGRHGKQLVRKKVNLDSADELIVNSLPYYPDTITVKEIARITGVKETVIRTRLQFCSICLAYPICDIGANQWCLISIESL